MVVLAASAMLVEVALPTVQLLLQHLLLALLVVSWQPYYSANSSSRTNNSIMRLWTV